MAYIYKITSKEGKVYVGSTKDVKARERYYRGGRCKGQRKLFFSIQKYGWNSHTFQIIEECDNSLQFIRERHWQDFYDVLGPKGLNCVLVGTDELPHSHSQDTKNRMSESRKGIKKSEEWQCKITVAITGKPKSADHKQKISMTKKGITESEETRKKKSLARIGKKHSEETKQKIRQASAGKTLPGKSLTQYNLDGTLVRQWKHVEEVFLELGYSKSYIRDASRGAYGHIAFKQIWKYNE